MSSKWSSVGAKSTVLARAPISLTLKGGSAERGERLSSSGMNRVPAAYWQCPEKPSRLEDLILKRLMRTGKLFAFLRRVRHRLFDEGFQQELMAMYSDSPR